MKPIVSASLMCANLLNLGKEISLLEKAGVNWLHIDVMDGQFVPNIVFGCPDLVKALKNFTKLPLDVHLMIEKPENHIQAFLEAGADIIVIHQESTKQLQKIINQIKEKGAKVGVALNPKTPFSTLKDYLFDLDLILIMTVNPGFAGQKFIAETLKKIKKASQMKKGKNIDIEVDGGLTLERITECANKGANVFVAGTSSIFEKETKKDSRIRDDINEIVKKIHGLSF